jgi:hypothetical protein
MYVSKKGKVYTRRTIRKILLNESKDDLLTKYKSSILMSIIIKNIKPNQYFYSSPFLNDADLEIADIKKLFALWKSVDTRTNYYFYDLLNFVSHMPSCVFSKTSTAKWIIKELKLDFDITALGDFDLWSLLTGINSSNNPKCITYIFKNTPYPDIIKYGNTYEYEYENTETYHIINKGFRIEFNDLKYDTDTVIDIKDDKPFHYIYRVFNIITNRVIYKNLTKLVGYYTFISPK